MSKHEWDEETRKQIEEISYFKWIDAGRPAGMEQQFWEEAEREMASKKHYDAVEEEIIEINFRRPGKKGPKHEWSGNGWKGDSHLDTGYYYAPYVPLQTTPVVLDPQEFKPKEGILTRYGKKLIEDGKKYYGNLTVSNTEAPEIKLNVESEVITAKNRKLKAQWTMEADQDLRATLSAPLTIPDILIEEMTREIDREIIADLRNYSKGL